MKGNYLRLMRRMHTHYLVVYRTINIKMLVDIIFPEKRTWSNAGKHYKVVDSTRWFRVVDNDCRSTS